MQRILTLGLVLIYAVAAGLLANGAADTGPGLPFSLAWFGLLLAHAVGQTLLRRRPDQSPRRQAGSFALMFALGCLIGSFVGISQIGFDNLGLGNFYQLTLGLGVISGMTGMALVLEG